MPEAKVPATTSMEKLEDSCGEGDYKQNGNLDVNGDVTEAQFRNVI
jgi:hypothetical protein